MKGIPEFWLTAFKTHIMISQIVTETDEEPLKSLTDIKVSYLDDNPVSDFLFDRSRFCLFLSFAIIIGSIIPIRDS